MKKIIQSRNEHTPIEIEVPCGPTVVISASAMGDDVENQDAAGVWALGEESVVLAVADGMGGMPGGAAAAATAMECVDAALASADLREPLRNPIVDAFEEANRQILARGAGSGTTLVVVEVASGTARSYHAGDSGALVVGQRGRVRMETVNHSTTGYGVEAGLLEREETHQHDDRHILSNCVGSKEMRIDIGAPLALQSRDTLLLATDGVLDNILHDQLLELIRKGSLAESAGAVVASVRAAMEGRSDELPAHPDDATAVLFRSQRSHPSRRGGRR